MQNQINYYKTIGGIVSGVAFVLFFLKIYNPTIYAMLIALGCILAYKSEMLIEDSELRKKNLIAKGIASLFLFILFVLYKYIISILLRI